MHQLQKSEFLQQACRIAAAISFEKEHLVEYLVDKHQKQLVSTVPLQNGCLLHFSGKYSPLDLLEKVYNYYLLFRLTIDIKYTPIPVVSKVV